jgi:uncharacterized protein YfaS (alpha-2-macroglobulin family)
MRVLVASSRWPRTRRWAYTRSKSGDHGHATFRVEEYKKPEFEVKVEAPKEPVKLGDQIEATIQAKYYFGAPVTKGKAKIKVLRRRID